MQAYEVWREKAQATLRRNTLNIVTEDSDLTLTDIQHISGNIIGGHTVLANDNQVINLWERVSQQELTSFTGDETAFNNVLSEHTQNNNRAMAYFNDDDQDTGMSDEYSQENGFVHPNPPTHIFNRTRLLSYFINWLAQRSYQGIVTLPNEMIETLLTAILPLTAPPIFFHVVRHQDWDDLTEKYLATKKIQIPNRRVLPSLIQNNSE